MHLQVFCIQPMEQNAYIYYDENTKDGVVVDPGGEGETLLGFIRENGLQIAAILLTHGHFDHIMAVKDLKNALQVPVAAHKDEVEILSDPAINFSGYNGGTKVSIKPDILLTHEEDFTFGGCRLHVIHTPGHTPGGVCYYDEAYGTMFTGDTLFKSSIGRTDLPGGNTKMLYHAISTRLLPLPEHVAVYPGHGPSSTIGREKKHNPYFTKDGN